MTTIAMGNDSQLGAKIVDLMHEFRHNVFVKRLGWTLPVVDGREHDKYDTPEAKYLVVANDAECVTACARLLPTTSRYMLAEQFPQLLGGCEAPKDPAIWELSRFATTVRETRDGRVLSLSRPTLTLLEWVFELARQLEAARLILVTSIGIERLMLRTGLNAHRIAPPAKVDGALCVALFIEVPSRPSGSTSIGAGYIRSKRASAGKTFNVANAVDPCAGLPSYREAEVCA